MMKTLVHYSSKNKIKNVIQRVKRKDGYGWRMVKMDMVGDGAWYLKVAPSGGMQLSCTITN